MAEIVTTTRKRSRRILNNSLNESISLPSEVVDNNVATLSDLLRMQWKSFHTSLILEKTREELNNAKCLSITKAIGAEFKNQRQISVNLIPCPGIRMTDTSPKGLLIEVLFSKQTVYMGYFVNWAMTNEMNDQFEKLPLLLVKAKSDITRVVNSVLIKAFDFVITPIFLNTLQLASLFTLFVNCADKEDDRSATLKYAVPGAPQSSFITALIRIRDLCTIFEFFSDSILEDEALPLIYYERILNHFRNAFQLDLARAELRQISFPDATATHTGTIQGKNKDVLSATLAALSTFFANNAPPPPPSSFASDSS